MGLEIGNVASGPSEEYTDSSSVAFSPDRKHFVSPLRPDVGRRQAMSFLYCSKNIPTMSCLSLLSRLLVVTSDSQVLSFRDRSKDIKCVVQGCFDMTLSRMHKLQCPFWTV